MPLLFGGITGETGPQVLAGGPEGAPHGGRNLDSILAKLDRRLSWTRDATSPRGCSCRRLRVDWRGSREDQPPRRHYAPLLHPPLQGSQLIWTEYVWLLHA